jgi:ABC-type phosphate transport system substrate-binding protein
MDWAKVLLTQEELRKIFLGHDKYTSTAWYLAAGNGQLVVLKKVRDWAEGVLTQEELKSIFLDKDKIDMPHGS